MLYLIAKLLISLTWDKFNSNMHCIMGFYWVVRQDMKFLFLPIFVLKSSRWIWQPELQTTWFCYFSFHDWLKTSWCGYTIATLTKIWGQTTWIQCSHIATWLNYMTPKATMITTIDVWADIRKTIVERLYWKFGKI